MSDFMIAIYILVLSSFVGYHVIWGVTPALHTPLMAVTNAISAIIIVGALLVAGYGGIDSLFLEIIGFFAVMLASINIFGGFIVTERMLSMFKNRK
ncbi:MAG: NAD(P) transhydrogenase subunit alpha [Candidatus Dadabacteria bacterium]|nr:MAG: NAD(P) transhydrogenase subunit alpha [Candidatus Dadabacteria bacterium]